MAVSVVSFSFPRAAQPEARGLSFLLSAGFLYHILSPRGLQNYWGPRRPLRPGVAFPTTSCLRRLWSPTHQDPKGPLHRAFSTTSYQQLLSTQLNQGPRRPLSAWCSFPYHISSLTPTPDFLSWLSNILVQRPLNLWNGMFDRHQAEITVMQFTGHFLPVHQSMSVPWDFFTLSHFISQIPPTQFISITVHWDVSLPSGTSLWNGILARVECQNTTIIR